MKMLTLPPPSFSLLLLLLLFPTLSILPPPHPTTKQNKCLARRYRFHLGCERGKEGGDGFLGFLYFFLSVFASQFTLCEAAAACAAYLIANSKHEGIITCACLGLRTCESAPGDASQGLSRNRRTNFLLNTSAVIKSFRIVQAVGAVWGSVVGGGALTQWLP